MAAHLANRQNLNSPVPLNTTNSRPLQECNVRQIYKVRYLISTTELTTDATVGEKTACLTNLQTYIKYKAVQFNGERSLTGLTIRKMAGAETLELPVKGAFIAVGLEPNSSLVASLLKLNPRIEIMIFSDCFTSYPGIFATEM